MLSDIWQRIVRHPKTTVGGAAIGGIAWYVLGSFHCQLPGNAVEWGKWAMVAGPVILGMIGKD